MFVGLKSLNSGLRESLLTFPSSRQEVSVGLILHWKKEDLEMCVGVRFKGMDALFLALPSKLLKSDCFWQETSVQEISLLHRIAEECL